MNKHLDIELDSQTISDLIYSVTTRVTHQLAQIDLRPTPIDQTLDDEPHVVYTTLSGAYQTKLILYAHRGFLQRLAENMSGEPLSDPDDLEEYSKEFFNVLCGQIVREIFQLSKAGAYFHSPIFLRKCPASVLDPSRPLTSLNFIDDQSGQLTVLYGELRPT